MKIIKLNRRETIVDDEDFEFLSQFSWCENSGYAIARDKRIGKVVRMHRLLMGNPKNKVVDHINRNSLDNRKANLRITDQEENSRNCKKHKGSSKYRGVVFRKHHKNKWLAKINVKYKFIGLGCYKTEKQAAIARDEYILKHNLKGFPLNFPNRVKDTRYAS